MRRRVKIVTAFAAVFLALTLLCTGLLSWGIDRLERSLYPQKYSEYVEYYAGKYQIDPLLLYAFIRTESGFDAEAHVPSTDARGLMQITEIAFDWIKSNIAPAEELAFEQMYDPETNVRFGSYYVSYCMYRYGNDISTAAAAYHSGWGTVDSLLKDEAYSDDGVTLKEFPYTQMNRYVRKIGRAYEKYKNLYG